MAKSHEYSVWFRPQEGAIRTKLDNCISNLAQKNGTPVFPGHVTVIGKIQDDDEGKLIRMSENLAKKVRPFDITLTGKPLIENVWQRSLAITVNRVYQLIVAMNDARFIFDKNRNTRLEPTPHLSLMYSKNLSLARRWEIYRQLPPNITSLSFRTENVYLYLTEGNPDQWKEIGCFDISPK